MSYWMTEVQRAKREAKAYQAERRERIATALAAGMLANASIPAEISNVNIIGEAVVLADALIAALEESP